MTHEMEMDNMASHHERILKELKADIEAQEAAEKLQEAMDAAANQTDRAVVNHGEDAIRVVDPDTGGTKDSKLARFDLIPVGPLTKLAEHFGKGAVKYDANNWRRSYNWSLSYAALQRHANAFWAGENLDPETGSPHMIAVAWHALALAEFMEQFPEKDDRWKGIK